MLEYIIVELFFLFMKNLNISTLCQLKKSEHEVIEKVNISCALSCAAEARPDTG